MKKLLFSLPIFVLVLLGTLFVINSCQKDNDAAKPIDPNAQVQYNFGFIPLPKSDYKSLPVAADIHLKALPASVTLVTPPIGNQGGEGSCVAWGTTYAGRSTSYYAKSGATSYSKSTNIFSPEYVYNQIKASSSCASGSYVTTGLDLLKSQGVCVWNTMPYTDVSCSLKPTVAQKAEAANYKISSYSTVSRTSDAIKTQLAAGKIVIVGGPVYNSFYNLKNGAIQTTATGKSLGGHCYAVVGYDDAKSAFKVQNSWGTSWASAGFGWIAYSLVSKVWTEVYVINE
jgi:C1A family cysteine protease